MQIELNYDFYKNLCLVMAQKIKEYKATEIICVVRGGMTASHIISKKLNLFCGMYDPKTDFFYSRSPNSKYVFVEDLVAQGRTYSKIEKFTKSNGIREWGFAPVIIDSSIDESKINNLVTYGIKTQHWIVSPYEDLKDMNEGDRGLFREGNDKYGK